MSKITYDGLTQSATGYF